MDPVTHTLFGLTLARSGLSRRTRLGGVALVVGANLPDVDAFCYLGGSADLGLWFRRGLTHGVLGIALLPLILTGSLLLCARRGGGRGGDAPRPWTLLLLSALAVASHPTLDWLNTYGVRWLMPFSGRWYYGDTLYIVDPWLWLVLGGGLFLSGARASGLARRSLWLVCGLLGTLLVLGTDRSVPAAVRAAWLAGIAVLIGLRASGVVTRGFSGERLTRVSMALAMTYIAGMLGVARAARVAVGAELERRGVVPLERLMVGPMPANPLVWEVVAATPSSYRYGRFRWWPRPALDLEPRVVARGGTDPAIEAAIASPAVRGLVNWARFPYYEVERGQDATTVHILDLRYARGRTRGFGGAAVRLGAGEGKPTSP